MTGSPLLVNQHDHVLSLSRRLQAAPPSRCVVALRSFGLLWSIVFFPAFWFYHGVIDGSRWSDVVVRNAQNEAITYQPWGWQSIYLTNWGGVTQLLFWLTALLCYGTSRGQRHVDHFFSLAWPVGVFIGVMFYAAILPEIIHAVASGECGHKYPATVDRTDVCGQHGNATCAATCDEVLMGAAVFGFCQHGVPMLLIVVEGCIVPHNYSPTWITELLAVMLYACAYIVWNQLCHWKNGFWPYPFQEKLQAPSIHAAYTVVLLALIFILYFVGRRCNKKRTRLEAERQSKTQRYTERQRERTRDAEMAFPGQSASASAASELAQAPKRPVKQESSGYVSSLCRQQARVTAQGVKLRVGAGPFAPVVAFAGDGPAPAGFAARIHPRQRLEVDELRVGSQVQVVERCENVAGGNGRKRSNWLKVRTADGIVGFLAEDAVAPLTYRVTVE